MLCCFHIIAVLTGSFLRNSCFASKYIVESSQHDADFLIRNVPWRRCCDGVLEAWEENVVPDYRRCVLHTRKRWDDRSCLGVLSDPMSPQKKLLESVGPSSNYERISRHAFMEMVHSTFSGESALKVGANYTHYATTISSSIPDRDRKEREEGIIWCSSTETFLMEHFGMPRDMNCDRYRAPLDTWVGWIAAAMRIEEPYVQKLLISKKGGRFMITGKSRLP